VRGWSLHNAQSQAEAESMLYSESERAWLERRAAQIAEDRGWPLPIAESEAAPELVRMLARKPAVVVQLRKDNAVELIKRS
jgi:hypothetical protein